jgi:IclR family transcriptional regulator, acetate operon repressor
MTAVSTALRVLEHVAVHQPIGVSDVARALDLPKSTVQRSLKELSDADWVEQESDGSRRWVQTVKLLNLAQQDGGRSIRGRALPVMRTLLHQVDENVHLALRSGSTIALIAKLESSKAVRPHDPLGVSHPLHMSSTGKAILAWASPDDIDFYLSTAHRHVPPNTPHIDPAQLADELEEIRACGYALNRGDLRPEIRAAAAPFFVTGPHPIAAISVALPTHRISLDELAALGELVARTVNPTTSPAGSEVV